MFALRASRDHPMKRSRGAKVARRRREGQAGDRTPPGFNEILEVLADGLGVAQVMMLLHEPVEQRFLLRAPHLAELEGPQRRKGAGDGARVELDRGSAGPHDEGVGRSLAHRRKRDAPVAVEREHEPAADHVPETAVLLPPVPEAAELP